MLSNMRRFILVCCIATLAACSSIDSKDQQQQAPIDYSEHFEQLNNNDQLSAKPEAVTGDIKGDAKSKPSQDEERFYVSVHESPAREFFLGLMHGTDSNIVVHPDVSGFISLELKDISLLEMLQVCRDIYGYTYELKNNIYTIYPPILRTQMFRIDYPDIKRIGVSDTSVLVGEVNSSSDRKASSSSGTSNVGAGYLGMLMSGDGESHIGGSGASVPGSRVQTLTQTDFWGGLRTTILAMIGGGKTGDKLVVVSPQTSTAIVKAYAHELIAIKEYLELAELIARQQVIIEAKILEVTLKKDFEAGINWSAISSQAKLVNNVKAIGSDIIEIDEGIGEVFASIVEVKDLQQLLQLMESQGEVQVLSSPRISTVNNQKAVIKVGSDEYFVTGISNTTTSTSSSTSDTPNIDLASFFSGIALDVTPQIADNNEVIMHIHPVISNVVDQKKDFIVGDDKFSLPLAHRDIRETDSIVKAASGQVIILGGLMRNDANNSRHRRPFISRIPIFGPLLFRGKSHSSQKTELVILLRPVVIENNDWSDSLELTRARMSSIQGNYKSP